MKLKLIHFIKFFILILFLSSLLFELHKVLDYIDVTGESFSWRVIVITKAFQTTLFLILPLIGIFKKNFLGWVLICQYFYFFLINFLLIFNEGLIVYSVILIPLSLILLMNYKKVSFDYFKIEKEKLLKFNIFAFVVGFCLAISLKIFNNFYYFDMI
ncbi:hypothetical protein GCM10011531_16050 [Aquaticitalea lipolytica]|uniref:Uncharacterized protein n=1 Tax=Aquaticitalea lipolytica TaxID=1247562 RepID=A0A8J2TST3_9FLAO|nr:hypothetical protein GCM10011531_16050 [Aquaticitalea lipolytica]